MKNVQRVARSQQAGFTLIELIVVIVILGILAATALPRFMDAGKEARTASLNAARGSLTAGAALAHSRWLINPNVTDVVLEGTTVSVSATSGYPTVAGTTTYPGTTAIPAMAGLNSTDYTVVNPSNTANSTTTPNTTGSQMAFIPASAAGTTKGAGCYVMYTDATGANTLPTVTVTSTGC